MPIADFNKTLDTILDEIGKEGKYLVLLGDFNINILSLNLNATILVKNCGSSL